MSKKGFPVSFSFEDIWTRALREGGLPNIELISTGIVAPSSGLGSIGSSVILPTEAFLARDMSVCLTKGAAVVQVQHFASPSNANVGEVNHRFALNNSCTSFTLNDVFTPASIVSAVLRNGDNTTPLDVTVNISGIRMTADFNFAADKVILWVGDSITKGSVLGNTNYNNIANTLTAGNPDDHFAFQVRNHFQRKGIDCRLVIKAMGGYTARQIGWWVRNGWLDIDQADVIFYQLGMNDATSGTTDQQYTDELNRVIDWRDRKHPKCKIVFVGATPANNNTTETRLATLRGLMAAKANADNKIYYVSLATAFDRATLTNYTGSDGVHPNIASNALMATVINNWATANNFTF